MDENIHQHHFFSVSPARTGVTYAKLIQVKLVKLTNFTKRSVTNDFFSFLIFTNMMLTNSQF